MTLFVEALFLCNDKKEFRSIAQQKAKSLYKATNDSGLKGRTGMLPWHAIPFLKGLGMLTPNPCQNG